MTMLFARMFRTFPRLAGLAVAVLATLLAPATVQAQSTATWTGGGGSGNWSTSSNWTVIPTTSGSWALVFGGTTQTTGTNTIGTITVNSLSFTNDGSAGKTGLFTLSGSTLSLTASAVITTTATSGGSLGSGDVVSNPLSLGGATAITLGSGHNLTLSGDISGGGSLAMDVSGGTATLNLTGSSTYSGGTTITGGVVQNGSTASDFYDDAFGTGGIVVSGSGTLRLRNGSTIDNNLTLSGSGGGLGALRGSFGTGNQTATVRGSVTLAGDATIQATATASGTNGTLRLEGPVSLGGNTLTLSPFLVNVTGTPLQIDVTGIISDSGAVVVSGSGASVVQLSNANAYSGGTTITSGILRVGDIAALGTGGLTANGGTLDLNGRNLVVGALSGSSSGLITSLTSGAASLTVNSAVTSTYAGAITNGSGAVSLNKTGSGSLNLTGSSSYSGGTTITGGVVQNGLTASDFYNHAFGTGDIVVSGSGTLRVRNGSTITNNLTLSGSGGGLGALRGSFGTADQVATLKGSVTLAGDATIQATANAGGERGKLVLEGPVNLGGNKLTLSPSLANVVGTPLAIELRGLVYGTGSVVVSGSGSSVVLMDKANTYSGGTTLESGILRVGNNDALGTGGVVVNGGTLDVNGKSLDVASLQMSDPGTVLMSISGTGAGQFAQVLADGTVTFGGSLAIDFTQAGFATGDAWQLFSSSTSTFSGGFASIAATGAYGNVSFTEISDGEWRSDLISGNQWLMFYENNLHAVDGRFGAGQLVVVPEPSTVTCAGIGIAIAAWGMRRSRSRRTLHRGAV
jgi:fibronectin-binding autotransporter adhesin